MDCKQGCFFLSIWVKWVVSNISKAIANSVNRLAKNTVFPKRDRNAGGVCGRDGIHFLVPFWTHPGGLDCRVETIVDASFKTWTWSRGAGRVNYLKIICRAQGTAVAYQYPVLALLWFLGRAAEKPIWDPSGWPSGSSEAMLAPSTKAHGNYEVCPLYNCSCQESRQQNCWSPVLFYIWLFH